MTVLDFERTFPHGGVRGILDELIQYIKEMRRDSKLLIKGPIIR